MKKSLAGKPRRQTKRMRVQKRMDAALEQLAQVELVKPLPDAERAYSIKHALVQDTAQSTLLHGEYKRLNLLVASAYETVYATRCMDEYAGLLAQYYAAAGDDAKTVTYAMHAGDLAASAYANAEAIAYYTQALDAAKRSKATTGQFIHLYTKRGRVFEVTGRVDEALSTYEEMTKVARARSDRSLELHSLLLRGTLHSAPSTAFDRAKALALADTANTLARELGDRTAEARSLWNQLLLYLYNSEIPHALRSGEQALALARELDAQELLGYILTDLARTYLQAGQVAKVPALEAEAREIWRELDNKPMLADNLMQTATQAMLRGDYDSALALAEEGIEISKTIDSKVSLMSSKGTQLFPYLDRGEFAHALEVAKEILRVSKEMSLNFSQPMASAFSAWAYGLVGAVERGNELAEQARLWLEQPLGEFFRTWIWVMLARYYLITGKLQEALDALAKGQTEYHAGRVDPAGMYGVIVLGDCLLEQGEFERAAQLMADRVTTLRQYGFRASLHDALFIQAKASRALGRADQAFELLHQARATAEGMQARRLLWQIYALLSEIETERGNDAEREKLRGQAREVLDYIGAHTPPENRASFFSLPRVREVLA